MGNARYSDREWNAHVRDSYSGKTREQVFTQTGIHPDLDPTRFAFREAVDSPANPESTPIVLACDETGSMGVLADEIIRRGLGTIFRELYDRKPVPDPQIACAGVGDIEIDRAPIQVTQFEADGVVLAQQIEKIYIEGGGGGNYGESYPIVWAFAGLKTKTDSFSKRGRKGYIFTIGDEQPHLTDIEPEAFKRFLGVDAPKAAAVRDILDGIRKEWNVFHLIVQKHSGQPVLKTWRELLGEHAIEVPETELLSQAVVSIIQMVEGQNPKAVVQSWDRPTGSVIQRIATQIVPSAQL